LPGGVSINKQSSSRTILLTIIAVAILLRIAAVIFIGNVNDPEGWEYSRLADNIVAGKGYSYTWFEYDEVPDPPVPSAIEGPFYTYFLVALYDLPFKYWVIEIFQSLLWGGVVWLVYLIARSFKADRPVALAASAIATLFPAFIYSPTQIHHTSFTMLFIMAAVYFAAHFRGKRPILSAVGFGLAIGLYLLSEPVGAIFAVVFSIWSLLRDRKRALLPVAVAAAVTIAVIAPWQIRNFIVLEYPFFIKSTPGQTLWIGNNEAATGTTRNENDASIFYTDLPQELHERVKAEPTEAGRHKILKDEALSYIKSNPLTTLRRDLWRVKQLWVCDSNHPKDRHPLNQIPNTALLITGAAGLIILYRKRKLAAYTPAICLWGAYTVVYSIILVVPRYRFPMLVLLAIPAAYALVSAFAIVRKGRASG